MFFAAGKFLPAKNKNSLPPSFAWGGETTLARPNVQLGRVNALKNPGGLGGQSPPPDRGTKFYLIKNIRIHLSGQF